jgi:hypothetical protein
MRKRWKDQRVSYMSGIVSMARWKFMISKAII